MTPATRISRSGAGRTASSSARSARMKSIAKGDEHLFWWSADNRIYRTVGYQEQRISTHAIEGIADASAGHHRSAYMLQPARAHLLLLNLPDRRWSTTW